MDTKARVARQRTFFSRRGSPDVLVFISENASRSNQPSYTGLMARVNRYILAHRGCLPGEEQMDAIVAEVVSEFRALWQ